MEKCAICDLPLWEGDPGKTWNRHGITEKSHLDCILAELNRREKKSDKDHL